MVWIKKANIMEAKFSKEIKIWKKYLGMKNSMHEMETQ